MTNLHSTIIDKSKIINLGDPTENTDAVNLKTLNTHIMKPSH